MLKLNDLAWIIGGGLSVRYVNRAINGYGQASYLAPPVRPYRLVAPPWCCTRCLNGTRPTTGGRTSTARRRRSWPTTSRSTPR